MLNRIVTRKGTNTVKDIPLKRDKIATSLPEYFNITGSVESMEVAPPDKIGDIFPNNFTKTGAKRSVIISLDKLEIRAIVPRVSPLIPVIIILDKL